MDLDQPTPEAPCLDDYPELARIASRQQSIVRWSLVLAVAPFAVLLFVVFEFFPNVSEPVGNAVAYISLLCGLGVTGYSFYLLVFGGIRCPACNYRFGSGDQCRNCNLPRHHRPPFLLPDLTADD